MDVKADRRLLRAAAGRAARRGEAAELAAAFKVLADPARLRLLSLIAAAPAGEAAPAIWSARWAEPSRPCQPPPVRADRRRAHHPGEGGRWAWYRVVPERLAVLRDALGSRRATQRIKARPPESAAAASSPTGTPPRGWSSCPSAPGGQPVDPDRPGLDQGIGGRGVAALDTHDDAALLGQVEVRPAPGTQKSAARKPMVPPPTRPANTAMMIRPITDTFPKSMNAKGRARMAPAMAKPTVGPGM